VLVIRSMTVFYRSRTVMSRAENRGIINDNGPPGRRVRAIEG